MDTDGYIKNQGKQITVKSNSFALLNQFKDFCKKSNIETGITKRTKCALLSILSVSFLNYARAVGFSHPRKKEILLNHLKEGPRYKVLKKINGKLPIELIGIFKHLRPYRSSVYIKLDEYGKKAEKQKINRLLSSIKNTFNVKVVEVKRNRRNNHFYICSKRFTEFVKDNATYDLPWQALNKSAINVLSRGWKL